MEAHRKFRSIFSDFSINNGTKMGRISRRGAETEVPEPWELRN